MGLPVQVARAEKQVEEMVGKLNQEPSENPKKKPVAPNDQALPPGNPQDEPQPETIEDLKKQLADTQQQLRTWQGKYKAEIEPIKEDVGFVQRTKGELRQLRGQVSDLLRVNNNNSQLISELRQQLEKPKEEPKPEVPQDPTKVLSQDELAHLQREDLSGETLNIIWKLVNTAADNRAPVQDYSNQFTELSNKVDQVNQRVEQTVQKTWNQQTRDVIKNYDKYFGDSADADFIAWLDSPISKFSRRTNREELQDGINTQDLDRVVSGIQAYEETKAVPAPEKPKQKDPLASQLEPDETIQGGQRPLGEKKTYALSEIQKFHHDQTRGLWRGREKEAATLSQEYIRAAQDGRITP